MSFPLKVLLTLLGLLVATVVGAAVWITLIFDPNDYRDDIAEVVRENTGRELRLEGPLKLRLFPQVAVEVNTLALANAKDFGPEPMLEVGRLLASVEVLPLLLDQAVRIGEIRLEQVRARIETRGERNNWEDIAKAQQEQAEAQDSPEEEPVELEVDSQGEAPDLRIEAILLQDISLIYIQDGAQTTLQLDSLATGPIRLGEPSTLALNLSAALPDGLTATLELRSQWLVAADGSLAELNGLELEALVRGPQVPGGSQQIRAEGKLRYEGSSQSLSLPALTLRAGQLQAELAAQLQLAEAGPQGNLSLKTNRFSAQGLAGSLGFPLGPEGHQGQTELDLAFALAPDSLRSTRLQGQLDGADFSGQLSLSNFSQPQIRTKLQLAQFTLEHWTPPSAEEEQSSKDDKGSSDDPMQAPLPLDLVKDLNLDAEARIGTFRGAGVDARDVLWVATGRPGQPFVHELRMNAYGGQIRAKNTIDARGSKPKTGLSLNLDAVGLGDLLKGTMGESWVTGLTQLALNLDTSGNTLQAMLGSAAGKAQYALKDGQVRGISILDVINAGAAQLQGSKAQAEEGGAATSFQQLAGELLFGGGRMDTRALKADSKLLALTGTGGIDLQKLAWDLNLVPVLKDSPQIREQKYLSKLVGIDIPLKVSGPLMSPKFVVDAEGALKARAKQEIDRQKDKLEDKAREKLDEKIKDSKIEEKLKKEVGEELGSSLGNLLRGRLPSPTPKPVASSPSPAPSPTP